MFLAGLDAGHRPTDFEHMARERAATAREYEAGARRALQRHRISMTTGEFGAVVCDLFTSDTGRPDDGMILYVFGGAFMVGDPFSDLPVIGALAEWTGMTVVAPRYRLAPEHPAPAAADDAVSVYRHLVSAGTVPIALAGESAGGNLALVTAQRVRDAGLPLPEVLALLSPAVDLRTARAVHEPNVDRDPSLHANRMDEVGRVYVGGHDPTDPTVSPIFGDMAGLPPTIITTGTRDLFMSMCVRLCRKMRRAGVHAECRVWDGLWHVFEFYDQYPEAAESLMEIAEFINRHAASGTAPRRRTFG